VKLALLGPAPPFRGGIVTYLAMLARTLADRGHELYWASFRKQYPRFLFPGTEQKGETATWLQRENQPRFVPWSAWSWWQTYRDIKRQRPDALVLKYWIPYFAPGFFAVTWLLRRYSQVRIVYILDNVIPHERYPLGRWLTRLALGQGHGFIAQSDQVRRDLFTVVPTVPPETVFTTPHPVYDFSAPDRPRKSQPEARRELALPLTGKLVLYFGFIKPYKGVRVLIDAVPKLKDYFDDSLQVLVVGDVYGDRQPYVERVAELGVGDVLRIVDEFVPDETVEDYFIAADLVVLPYLSATQSGIVQIAYNYDKPVVTTTVGGLPEVVREGVTGFLVPPGDPGALAEAVIRFFEENRASEFTAAVAREKKKYSWDRMADAIESLACLGGNQPDETA